MKSWRLGLTCVVLATCLGCATQVSEKNPFLTYVEAFGASTSSATSVDGGAGAGTEETFRAAMTLTFINVHPGAVLDTSFIAWVKVSSVRSAEQQDALLRGGYVQLTREVQIGSVYTLPVGTFVLNGPGTAGATAVTLAPAEGGDEQQATVTTTSTSFTFITPDQILVFSQPPVSCDSVAFTFSDPDSGNVLAGASTGLGGYKTLAQVDVYECDPLQPGLFYDPMSTARQPNQYEQGDPVTITFSPGPQPDGSFANVFIGEVPIVDVTTP